MNGQNLSKIPYKQGRIWFNRALVYYNEPTEDKEFMEELYWVRKELDI